MKILNIILVAITALLSLAAGMAKVMQTPQELAFLQSVGLSVNQVVIYGIVQTIGGLLVIPRKTRVPSTIVAIAAFALSTFYIFSSGNTQFGIFSLLPIVIGLIVLYQAKNTKNSQSNTSEDRHPQDS